MWLSRAVGVIQGCNGTKPSGTQRKMQKKCKRPPTLSLTAEWHWENKTCDSWRRKTEQTIHAMRYFCSVNVNVYGSTFLIGFAEQFHVCDWNPSKYASHDFPWSYQRLKNAIKKSLRGFLLSICVQLEPNININVIHSSSLSRAKRLGTWWNHGSQLAIKSITKSITYFQTQLALCKQINRWTHPERPAGSWWWWRWRYRSWPGCCHRSCCQFLPCRSRRGCRPWPASNRSRRGCLRGGQWQRHVQITQAEIK